MNLTAAYKISITGFLLAICASGTAKSSELKVTGKLLANSPQSKIPITYVGRGRSVELDCKLDEALGSLTNGTAKPQWSFLRSGSIVYEDVKSHCMENIKKSMGEPALTALKTNASFPLLDCEIELEDDSPHFTLELKRIQENEFGDYVCRFQKESITFTIEEHITLTRKSENGKLERSVTLTVNETLWLYCNSTGLRNYHVVSWWKDGENITSDLNKASGLFKNFTKTDDLEFYGTALLEHRGNYTCEVDLNSTALEQFPNLASSRSLYPVEHSFYVRVKEGGLWQMPLYILSGEVALIGLFTLFLNWREKRVGEDAGDESDYEDDDTVVPAKNGVNGNKEDSANGK